MEAEIEEKGHGCACEEACEEGRQGLWMGERLWGKWMRVEVNPRGTGRWPAANSATTPEYTFPDDKVMYSEGQYKAGEKNAGKARGDATVAGGAAPAAGEEVPGTRGTEEGEEVREGSKALEEAGGEGRKGVWKGERMWRSQTTMEVSPGGTMRSPTRWGPNWPGGGGRASCRRAGSCTSPYGG